MIKDVAIFVCNKTMHAPGPWHRNGYIVILVDPQHPQGITVQGRVIRVGLKLHEALPYLGQWIRSGRVAFVGGFPVCTDVSLSGTKHWERKRKADPYFQAKAAILAEQCRTLGELSGGKWYFENPKSAFSMIFGKPQHKFHPWHYTGLRIEDNYTKDTWLWTGGDFVMPSPQVDAAVADAVALVRSEFGRFVKKPDVMAFEGWAEHERTLLAASYPDDRIHKMGRSADRGDKRSETPLGFCEAVFACNGTPLPTQLELVA